MCLFPRAIEEPEELLIAELITTDEDVEMPVDDELSEND